ncbi:2OG-Fe(II) oxygenase [Flavobacteriaceae bacterium 3519-10]|nr:2OG-Fe(II) oxygenase [Flavobacteriaceae bacterium 3519-10]
MMSLFDNISDPNLNLLPKDGTVNYYGKILSEDESSSIYQDLLDNIEWKNDEAVIFGKTMITKRKVAWYGDREFSYTYSKSTKTAIPWTATLLKLKKMVENATGEAFNSCLLNLYHSGEEGMGWHSDAEKDLKKNGAIASLSLGAERRFLFKHKHTADKVETVLEHGSLLVMKNETQSFWQHRLPPARKILTPRINLTFRSIDEV